MSLTRILRKLLTRSGLRGDSRVTAGLSSVGPPVGRRYSVHKLDLSGFTDGDVGLAAPCPQPLRTRDHSAPHGCPPCQEQAVVVRARNRDRPPSPPVRPRPGLRRAPGSPGRREPAPSPAAHRRPTPDRTPSLAPIRSLAHRCVGQPLPPSPGRRTARETRDRHRLAPYRLAPHLALALPPSAGPSARRCRSPRAHPADVAREPHLGSEDHRRRIGEARLPGLPAHRREVPTVRSRPTTRPTLDHVHPQPPARDLGLRLLRPRHREIPRPLRLRRSLPRPAHDRPRWQSPSIQPPAGPPSASPRRPAMPSRSRDSSSTTETRSMAPTSIAASEDSAPDSSPHHLAHQRPIRSASG